MFKTGLILTFSLVLIAQVSNADEVEDAEAALTELRETLRGSLSSGYAEHMKITADVDQAALDTKRAGEDAIEEKIKKLEVTLRKVSPTYYKTIRLLAKAAADDLAACIESEANEALDHLYMAYTKMMDESLKITYDAEKEIIRCGPSDTECLTGLTDEIKEKTPVVGDVLNEELEAERTAADGHIDTIKACGEQAAARIITL